MNWELIIAWAGAALFIVAGILTIIYRRAKNKRGNLDCPHCGDKLQIEGFLGVKKDLICKCGAQIKLHRGFFSCHIESYQPPT